MITIPYSPTPAFQTAYPSLYPVVYGCGWGRKRRKLTVSALLVFRRHLLPTSRHNSARLRLRGKSK